MAIVQKIINKFLENIKTQLPATITEEDIITALNITHLRCNDVNDISQIITNIIIAYYQNENKSLDETTLKNNFNNIVKCIDKDLAESLKVLMFSIWMYKLFDHPLLFNDFFNYLKNTCSSNTEFLGKKILLLEKEINVILQKISSNHNPNNLHKLKRELNNKLDIFKHFKFVCEDYQLSSVKIYNFIAVSLKTLFIDDDINNIGIILLDSKVAEQIAKIKEIIKEEVEIEEELIVDNSDSQDSYLLKLKLLTIIFKDYMFFLLNKYELKIAELKENQSELTKIKLQINIVEKKIKNIFNLSKNIFDIFKTPVKLLPLSVKTVNFFNENNSKIFLDKALKQIIANIEKNIEKLEKEINQPKQDLVINKPVEVLSNDDQTKTLVSVATINSKITNKKAKLKKNNQPKQDLVINKPVEVLSNDDKTKTLVSVATINSKITNKKAKLKKNNQPKQDSAINKPVEVLSNDDQTKVIFDIKQVLPENDKKEIAANLKEQDEFLKTKVNELEIELKKSQIQQQQLQQQLIAEKQKVQLLTLKVSTLENEKIKLVDIKNQNSVKINNISKNLEELQRKLTNAQHNKSKKVEKLKKIKNDLRLEMKTLENENKNSSQHIKKINEELVKTQQALVEMKSQNQQLHFEVSELKQQKINVENLQQANDVEIKLNEESISLLENKMINNTIQKDDKVKISRLKKKNNKLNLAKQRLQAEKAELEKQLIEKQNMLSEYNVANAVMFPYQELQEICQPVLLKSTILAEEVVPLFTGNKVLIEYNTLSCTPVGCQVTEGFCVQTRSFQL